MKMVVTGAGGLLGSALVAFASRKYEVYSLYNEHQPAYGTRVQVDLRDRDRLSEKLASIRPDIIVHAASLTDVDLCEDQKELADMVNHEATAAIAKAAKTLDSFLVYVSTDYVFDGAKGTYREVDRTNPINFYGLSKLRGEEAVETLAKDFLIARASVIFGAVPASGKANFVLWLLEKLRSGQPATVVMDQYVSPTLNTNLAEMILDAVDRRVSGLVHMSGASRVNRFEFAERVCEEWGLSSSLLGRASMSQMKWKARRPKDSSLDVSKASSVLSTKPLPVSESLKALRSEMAARE